MMALAPVTPLDLYLEWNDDFIVTPSGDLQTAVGWDQVRERILRRLLTNSQQTLPNGRMTVPDYIWDPSYGFGAGALVGQNITVDFINDLARRVTRACYADVSVATDIPPSVTYIQPTPQTLVMTVSVVLTNGLLGRLALNVRGG